MEKIDLEKTDWSKYTDESLDLILTRGGEYLKETIVTMREVSTKSYGALAIYVTILSFCITKVVETSAATSKPIQFYIYAVMSIGLFISIVTLMINLFPRPMTFSGSEPKALINSYYESSQTQLRLHKQRIIIGTQQGIDENNAILDKMLRSFKISLYCFFCCLIICVIMFLFLSSLS